MNNEDLIAEAREALGRINIHAFPDDLAYQYRGGVLPGLSTKENEMTKELIEGTPKGGCGEGLCTACATHDFTPSLVAVREAQRGLANEHVSGDEIVAAFDRMVEKLVADALATRVPVQGEPNGDREES